MTTANYKYAINSESGYSSDQKGKITPERHGVVCAALDGFLVDDADVLKAAPALLAAADSVMAWWEIARHETYIGIGGEWPWYSEEPEFVADARAAIILAKGESPCSPK